MTGASASLRATLTGNCPAQRIHDSKAGCVRDIVHRSVITEYGTAECHRCGRTVRVTRRFDDGRWGWSPWRYEDHKPTDPHTKPLGTSPEPVKSGLDSSHMDHGNGSQ